jgi:hypothetical protein
MHITYAFSNYAGFLFDLQYDSHELSQIGIFPAGPHVGLEVPEAMGLHPGWEYPGSQTEWQTVVPLAVWISPSQAAQSGMTVWSSSMYSLFAVTYHAKNTDPANNSDIDITVSPWQILHIVESGTYHLSASDWVYMTEGGMYFENYPGYGRWFHVPEGTTSVWIPASAFVATNAWIQNVAGHGIEHIPEPAAIGLVLGGMGLVVLARRRR